MMRLDAEHAQSDGKSVKRGLPVLDLPRGRDSWCWPKGARPLRTRMFCEQIPATQIGMQKNQQNGRSREKCDIRWRSGQNTLIIVRLFQIHFIAIYSLVCMTDLFCFSNLQVHVSLKERKVLSFYTDVSFVELFSNFQAVFRIYIPHDLRDQWIITWGNTCLCVSQDTPWEVSTEVSKYLYCVHAKDTRKFPVHF